MKHLPTSLRFGVVAAALFCLPVARPAESARVWEDRIVLPTYPENPPDPNPAFELFSDSAKPNYPYAVRNNSGDKKKDVAWRAINIENEYLACRILPDLGGHLYNCRDKIADREIFYANPVVRKRMEGLRGAWVAMGIESNFPVGHTRMTVSPVDFATRSDADGTAAAIVGYRDRITGMQWSVQFILRPGSAVLEQQVTLYNRSAVRRPYSWWANAAIEVDDKKMRTIFPTHIMKVHETNDLIPWPAARDQKDLSLVASHSTEHGFFAFGSREPFMGIYKPTSRTGVAHFAERGLKGKKLWLWGPEGDERVKATLTDHFNSYIEVQAGLFVDQSTFEFLQPEELTRFTEYWIPYRGMGGLSRANANAVVYANRSSTSQLLVEIMATRRQQGARVVATCGGKSLLDTTTELDPAKPFSRQLNDAAAPCKIAVYSPSGIPLLEHVEGFIDADDASTVKLGPQPQKSWVGDESEPFLLARADANELEGRLHLALQDYTQALAKTSSSARAQTGAARIAAILGRAEEASRYGSAAAQADEEAAYYGGIGNVLQGDDPSGRALFERVKAGSQLFYPAQLQLGLIVSRARDDQAALRYLDSAAGDGRFVTRAAALQVPVLRHAGKTEEARARLDRWLNIDPSNSLLRFERLQLGGSDDGIWAHLAGDPERILNLVDDYMDLGYYDYALAVLNHKYPAIPDDQVELGMPAPDRNALLAYYRGYCRFQLRDDPSGDWRSAAQMPVRYVFPSRPSSRRVLERVIAQNQRDPVALYLLGCLDAYELRIDDAIAHWQRARDVQPSDVLLRNLGRALLVKGDVEDAYEVLKEGARLDKQNADLQAALETATTLKNTKRTVVQHATTAAPRTGVNPIQLAVAAMMKAAGGSVAEAITALGSPEMKEASQTPAVQQASVEVKLQSVLSMAMSGQCPEALKGIDEFAADGARFVKYPHVQYYLGFVEAKCGNGKAARKRWSRIHTGKEKLPSAEMVYPFVAAAMVDPADAQKDSRSALDAVQAELGKPENAEHTWLLFAQGMLLRTTGRQQEGLEALKRAASTTTDPLVQYLSITELRLAESK